MANVAFRTSLEKTMYRIVLFVFLIIFTMTDASAAVTIRIQPSPAPNAFGSPSWMPYLNAAQASLQGNLGSTGNPAVDPAAYHVLEEGFYTPQDVMVTSGISWRGVANPGVPFDGEHGNRLHFGVAIEGDGVECFTLRDVTFVFTSSDGALNFVSSLAGTTLDGTNRVGLDYGSDNLPGGGDDIVLNAGQNDTTCMDALYYRGPGNAYWPDGAARFTGVGIPSSPFTNEQSFFRFVSTAKGIPTLQEQINETIAYIYEQNVSITVQYVVGQNPPVSMTLVLRPLFSNGFED